MPLHRRLAEARLQEHRNSGGGLAEVNLDRIQQAIDAKLLDVKATLNAELLVKARVLRRAKDGVRLLGRGEIKAKLNIEVHGASKLRHRGGREGGRHGENPGAGNQGRRRGGVTSASSLVLAGVVHDRMMDLS